MSNFHGTYEKNLKDGDFKTDGGESVLNKEIGVDDMTSAGVQGNKISTIAPKTFTTFERHVNQDTVATSQGNIENLNGELPIKIKDIREQVADIALKSISDLNEQAGQQLELVTKTLDALCRDVKRAAEDVQINLNVLKSTKIDVNLKRIHGLIDDLRTTQLGAVIGLTNNFLTQFADKAGEQIVKDLEQDANIEVTKGETDIIHELRKRYIAFIKLLLTEFSSKCKNDLYGLPDEITKDADKGAKGFMKQLATFSEMHLQRADLTNLASFSRPATSFIGDLLEKVASSDDIGAKHNALSQIGKAVRTMLNKITKYNHKFLTHLSALSSLLATIRPASYADDSNPLLECLKKGVQRMCDELDKAYVSVYDSETFGAELVEKNKVTPYGTQLSKVFLSILEIYNEDLRYLKNRTIHKWSTSRIYAGSSLGTFLQNSGYGVSNNETEQNGHLDKNANGTKIMSLLVGENYGHVYHKNKNYKFQLENLYDCLTTYYRIRHISTAGSKKSPCNIYEMLCWLTSLQYSSVYLNFISDEFSDLFDKRENKIAGTNEVDGISFEDQTANKLAAYPQNITYTEVHNAIVHVTSLAPVLLTSIVGYGNEYTTYAVDFYCNTHNFAYPSSSVDCLNTLIEHLRRIVPVFQFLLTRCGFAAKYHGWSDCTYGRDVKSSTWPCNEHSKTEVECQSTSPLQSFLRDCLPGHLPHELTSTGCKSECKTCPKSLPGAPCITPLGFRGFTGSKKTGKELCKVLTKFLGNGVASCLFGLIPKPPSTLSQHFAFTMSLVRNWQSNGTHSLKTNIEAAVTEQSIRLFEQPSDLTAALRNAYGDVRSSHKRESHPEAKNADLCTLSTSTSCTYASSDKLHCGPYLSTLCLEEYRYFADKHCNLYLSWAVYLPWTFYGYLKALLQAFCSISCQDWGCSKCIHGVKCKKGQHGVDNCQCRGLVECRGVQSTFYNYGFTFGNPETLLAKEGKKYCHHFHQQLKSVLESQYFAKLFEECDNFLWIIRQPFIWMNVALWSLSLFYLICVMVGRLDVLHIRSHLRIPSSHSITAQSLLAAAQVGRLAKISYLQP
ncbi:hypothetical protein, conserved [Babesia bigemina]|nr:hypothetical protein, conserved [Babesia bigemina]CDR71866.1 hypothetical protein, conserved [Babesia bigemina]|eukprot:XP_012770809.1 hypothetical protein, conserved [Babesia bigemina]